ncbi:C39 family peptidase [Fundicoccus culcitae]|uniref:C39 family peptidase n=1 Tax=Fundicoccus culcitae TaxID=2969821 RepID=A0ABY5P5J2_9LACT|nr:C39 family peptidase [Fundicoccus culcitae]UUX34014.1 C39 family peptidase [Fundicoccus culcitae]
MARKTQAKNPHRRNHLIIGFILIIVLIGMGVTLFLMLQSHHPNEAMYREVAEENENYLLENQAIINQTIYTNQDNPKDLGYIFLPENPATYIDIAHINQYNVPLLNQNDPQWANDAYGTDGSRTIWENGCAIVVLAMVDSYFSGSLTTPNDITRWSSNNYYMDYQGSSWQLYPAFGEAFNYQVTDYGNDFQQAIQGLNEGYLIVTSVGPGYFTLGGHVILIRGYQDGLVYVNDPNDDSTKMHSIQGIPEQTIIQDGLNYWGIRPW